MAIYEDVQLKQLAEELRERENKPIPVPSYHQVYEFVKSISQETSVKEARSGLPHAPRARMSPKSFVLSIPYPAHMCQVDEHTMDLLVVTSEGTVLSRRVHGAVLICVKTAAILSAVLSASQPVRGGLHAVGEDGDRAQGAVDDPLRLSTPLALFRQTGGHLSRPGQDLHLRAGDPGISGSSGHHD